ncbi:MAG TPA: class I SAM-dependent methyltransferase [Stellaceae bacterium]|nr:class I SAM-dependent methyltransferase [Stellaceae bacterium]
MSDLYKGGAYKASNPSWHIEDSPWKAAHIAGMVHKHRLHPQTICEVGCGAGEVLARLAEAFPQARLSGYEVSPQAFELCQERSSERLRFFLRDLTAEKNAFFDVLLVIDVFEHVEDYFGFLRAIRPRAKSKLFHIPLDLSLLSLLRGRPILALRRSVGHIHYFFKDTALASLVDCGYRIIDYTYTASRLELPNLSLAGRLLKLPRRSLFKIKPDFAVRVLGGYSLLVLAE